MLLFAYRPYVPVNTNRPKKKLNKPNKWQSPLSSGEWIGVIAILTFLVWTVVYPYQEGQRLIRIGHQTVAVITHAGVKNVTVAYWVNRQQHHKVLSRPHPSLQQDERYTLLYDPEDPSKAMVLFE